MSRLFIIGEAASRTSDPTRPLSGSSGARLASLAGVAHSVLLDVIEARNLFFEAPERWPAREARKEAATIEREFEPGDEALLLGRRVGLAFYVLGDYLTEERRNGVTLTLLPHPSRRNLALNDETLRARVSYYLTAAVRRAIERNGNYV